MADLIRAVDGEFRRYKKLAEGALAQIDDAALNKRAAVGNSIATICWHIAGNLESRFTDFLTSDGEKPWRDRESEFAERTVSRADLMAKWERGWAALISALDSLTDAQRDVVVRIRQQELTVEEALLRSLSHVSLHVGQIVDRAHQLRGADWEYLTIPPGQSASYNANPTFEKPSPR